MDCLHEHIFDSFKYYVPSSMYADANQILCAHPERAALVQRRMELLESMALLNIATAAAEDAQTPLSA